MAVPPPGVYVPSSFGLNQPAPKPPASTPYTGPTPGGTTGYQETKVSPAATETPETVKPTVPAKVPPQHYPNVSVSDVTGPGLNFAVEGRESTYQKDVITDMEDVPSAPFIPSSVGIPHTNYIIIPSSFGLNQDYQSQADAEWRYWRDRTSVGLAQTPYSAAGGAAVQQDAYYYYLTGEHEPQIPILPSFGLRQSPEAFIGAGDETARKLGDATFWDFVVSQYGFGEARDIARQRAHDWFWEPSPAQQELEEGAVFWQGISRQQAGGGFYDLTAPSPHVAVPRIVEYSQDWVPGVSTSYNWQYMTTGERVRAASIDAAILAAMVIAPAASKGLGKISQRLLGPSINTKGLVSNIKYFKGEGYVNQPVLPGLYTFGVAEEAGTIARFAIPKAIRARAFYSQLSNVFRPGNVFGFRFAEEQLRLRTMVRREGPGAARYIPEPSTGWRSYYAPALPERITLPRRKLLVETRTREQYEADKKLLDEVMGKAEKAAKEDAKNRALVEKAAEIARQADLDVAAATAFNKKAMAQSFASSDITYSLAREPSGLYFVRSLGRQAETPKTRQRVFVTEATEIKRTFGESEDILPRNTNVEQVLGAESIKVNASALTEAEVEADIGLSKNQPLSDVETFVKTGASPSIFPETLSLPSSETETVTETKTQPETETSPKTETKPKQAYAPPGLLVPEDEDEEKEDGKKKKYVELSEVTPLEGFIPGLDIYLPTVTNLPKSKPIGTLTETIAGTKARTKATPKQEAVYGAKRKTKIYRSDQKYLGRTLYARNLGTAI